MLKSITKILVERVDFKSRYTMVYSILCTIYMLTACIRLNFISPYILNMFSRKLITIKYLKLRKICFIWIMFLWVIDLCTFAFQPKHITIREKIIHV